MTSVSKSTQRKALLCFVSDLLCYVFIRLTGEEPFNAEPSRSALVFLMSLFSTSESWPRPLPLLITSKGPHLLPFLSTLPPSLILDLVSSNQLLRGRHPIHQIYQNCCLATYFKKGEENIY